MDRRASLFCHPHEGQRPLHGCRRASGAAQSLGVLKTRSSFLSGSGAWEKCPYPLRRVEVWNEEKQQTLVFLTNQFDFGASTIAAIYKERWQIELFFKALKQNLKIKTFVGTSANAVKIQVWTALIAILILRYLQLKSKFAWSLSNLVALAAHEPIHLSRPVGLAGSTLWDTCRTVSQHTSRRF